MNRNVKNNKKHNREDSDEIIINFNVKYNKQI